MFKTSFKITVFLISISSILCIKQLHPLTTNLTILRSPDNQLVYLFGDQHHSGTNEKRKTQCEYISEKLAQCDPESTTILLERHCSIKETELLKNFTEFLENLKQQFDEHKNSPAKFATSLHKTDTLVNQYLTCPTCKQNFLTNSLVDLKSEIEHYLQYLSLNQNDTLPFISQLQQNGTLSLPVANIDLRGDFKYIETLFEYLEIVNLARTIGINSPEINIILRHKETCLELLTTFEANNELIRQYCDRTENIKLKTIFEKFLSKQSSIEVTTEIDPLFQLSLVEAIQNETEHELTYIATHCFESLSHFPENMDSYEESEMYSEIKNIISSFQSDTKNMENHIECLEMNTLYHIVELNKDKKTIMFAGSEHTDKVKQYLIELNYTILTYIPIKHKSGLTFDSSEAYSNYLTSLFPTTMDFSSPEDQNEFVQNFLQQVCPVDPIAFDLFDTEQLNEYLAK